MQTSDRKSAGVHRRAALSLMSGAGLCALSRPGFAKSAAARALLATPEQIEAERTLLSLLQDPELKRIQGELKTELAATPRGQMPDAAATLEGAIAQWTNSLLFAELTSSRSPAIFWGTDDTPRAWLGHTLGGVGTSGDNPDAIYRMALIHGEGSYELIGRFDPAHRPAQLVVEADRGDLARPAQMMVANPSHPDLGVQIALLTDPDLAVAPDGTFRLTLGPGAGGPQHITTEPGPVTLGFRDMLADWRQRPCRLTLRRLDHAQPEPSGPAELRRRARADLADYVRFWARFPEHWMGGLPSNTVREPGSRAGGWGFVSGLRYTLAPGEAMVVTTTPGGARYTGFQVIDPWMIAPDGRRHQASLNLAQTTPNADGSFTYVISPQDPGVANWLDTAGLREGFGIIRWQAVPKGATKDGLLREHRVVQLSEIAGMPGLARVTPEQRRESLNVRARSYASRAR
jgi:hypothetical protein